MRRGRVDEFRRVLKDVAADMKSDADRFDGKPFNGRTVAEYFGVQGAAIAALARILDEVMSDLGPVCGD